MSHANLFVGSNQSEMEAMVIALAQTLHCENPPSRSSQSGLNTDACGKCRNCRLIAERKHPEIHWIYPESKIRVITTDQIHCLIDSSHLRSLTDGYEMFILCSADRLNLQAANAFLKTLEEPVPGKMFILLTHDAQKIIPTILSRCRHFIFEGINRPSIDSATSEWLRLFAQVAASTKTGILSRYTLLAPMISRLTELQQTVESELRNASPLSKYTDVEKNTSDRWEKELAAAVAAEYRRQRTDMLTAIELWLRDIWLTNLTGSFPVEAHFTELQAYTETVAARITSAQATANLKTVGDTLKLLDTNVQEALILEVFLLKLAL